MRTWPDSSPDRSCFTRAERRVVDRLATPRAVQRYLNGLAYNTEPPPGGPQQRTFRSVVATGMAHCLEAALTAAVILEQHGYPPTVMSLESIDGLDHVIFVYKTRTGWGSVARSRDPGLHGRKPLFRSLRDLALSYVEPYIDTTGCVRAYGMVVDSGCMKCRDCVSVCPNDALYYGFGPLPIFARARAPGAAPRHYPLTWPEEILVALAEIYVRHFAVLQADVHAMLAGEGRDWDPAVLEAVQRSLTANTDRMIPAVDRVLNYVHQRTLQRLTLEAMRRAEATGTGVGGIRLTPEA